MKDKATQRTLERLVNAVDALTEEVQGIMDFIAATQQSGEAAQKAKQTEEQGGKAAPLQLYYGMAETGGKDYREEFKGVGVEIDPEETEKHLQDLAREQILPLSPQERLGLKPAEKKPEEKRSNRAEQQNSGKGARKRGYIPSVIEAFSVSGRTYATVRDTRGVCRDTKTFANSLRMAVKRAGRGGDIEVQRRGDQVLLINRHMINRINEVAARYSNKEEFEEYLKQKGVDSYARDMGLI